MLGQLLGKPACGVWRQAIAEGAEHGLCGLLGALGFETPGRPSFHYLGSRAERQRRELARREEELHIQLVPEGEREEIRQIFAAKGFEGRELERVVEVITSDPALWAETMMTEELGYGSTEPNELRAAASTLLAFLTVGFLPLAAFVYDLVAPGALEHAFTWSAVMTGIAFFVVGSIKARFVEQAWWRSGLETLAVGGIAAVLAFTVGALLIV